MAIKTYSKGKATQLSTNFKSTEFDCHGNGCCTQTQIDDKLIEYVQKIRDHFGKSVNVSSGYRCATHNKNIGGATGSRHSKGQAADIYISGVAPAEIAKYAESIGILGIGLYETDKDDILFTLILEQPSLSGMVRVKPIVLLLEELLLKKNQKQRHLRPHLKRKCIE